MRKRNEVGFIDLACHRFHNDAIPRPQPLMPNGDHIANLGGVLSSELHNVSMPRQEVTPEAIEQHLAFLKNPERAIEPLIKIYEIEVVVMNIETTVNRRFEISANATFWDLFVAIENAFNWPYLMMGDFVLRDPKDGERQFVLPEPLMWTTPLRRYIPKEYHSARFLTVMWEVYVTSKRHVDPVPGRSYPHLLGGVSSAPADELMDAMILDALTAAQNLPSQPTTVGELPFDPREVSFDDPEEVWIEHYCEEPIIREAVEKNMMANRRNKAATPVFDFVLPGWFRDFLVQNGRQDLLSNAKDDPEHPGFIVLPITPSEITKVADFIQMKQFQSQDLPLNRRLERLMLKLNWLQFGTELR